MHYLDLIHWALGQDTPLAVTAMGGKFAIEDNREVPDTLEVVWQYPNNTLVTFSQFNATGAGYAPRPGEIEFRGTKGTLYLQWNGYEMVPEIITQNEFPARTPLDRAESKAYRKGAKAEIEGKKGTRRRFHGAARAKLPRLREEPREVQRRPRHRPPRYLGRPHRQHRPQDQIASSNGTARPRSSPTTRPRTNISATSIVKGYRLS